MRWIPVQGMCLRIYYGQSPAAAAILGSRACISGADWHARGQDANERDAGHVLHFVVSKGRSILQLSHGSCDTQEFCVSKKDA